jgi:hypothetical protein
VARNKNLADIIETILRLRAVERRVAPDIRTALAETRELLEEIAGSTVRPATAARLLGVSQTALNRWLDRADVASVLGPNGRREIPLAELVGLLEDVRQLGVQSSSRPLAAVIGRRRDAEEAPDLEASRVQARRSRGRERAGRDQRHRRPGHPRQARATARELAPPEGRRPLPTHGRTAARSSGL